MTVAANFTCIAGVSALPMINTSQAQVLVRCAAFLHTTRLMHAVYGGACNIATYLFEFYEPEGSSFDNCFASASHGRALEESRRSRKERESCKLRRP